MNIKSKVSAYSTFGLILIINTVVPKLRSSTRIKNCPDYPFGTPFYRFSIQYNATKNLKKVVGEFGLEQSLTVRV